MHVKNWDIILFFSKKTIIFLKKTHGFCASPEIQSFQKKLKKSPFSGIAHHPKPPPNPQKL